MTNVDITAALRKLLERHPDEFGQMSHSQFIKFGDRHDVDGEVFANACFSLGLGELRENEREPPAVKVCVSDGSGCGSPYTLNERIGSFSRTVGVQTLDELKELMQERDAE
ncbi:hypothetical protein [Kordiimonas sp.]|uniref:hypothetical protein n=1 Tax=Kordiimonas sp. TaxID=1970157 RepID=UPI003A914D42